MSNHYHCLICLKLLLHQQMSLLPTFPPLKLNGALGKVPREIQFRTRINVAPETSIPPRTAVVSPSKELMVILPPAARNCLTI